VFDMSPLLRLGSYVTRPLGNDLVADTLIAHNTLYWIDSETGTPHGTAYDYDAHVPVDVRVLIEALTSETRATHVSSAR